MRSYRNSQFAFPKQMQGIFTLSWRACLVAATLFLLCAPVANASLVLANDANGNGAVTGVTVDGFTLTGSDFAQNDPLAGYGYLTTYTDVAASDINVVFDWAFTNYDTGSTLFDLGGYLIDGSAVGLNDPFSASSSATGEAFAVLSGQTYGWYVYTVDAQNGAGQLAVSNIVVSATEAGPTGVPEPMSLALFGLGCVFLWGVRHRKTAPRMS